MRRWCFAAPHDNWSWEPQKPEAAKSYSLTPDQSGVAWTVEIMSTRLCRTCGAPGKIRVARWVRPECDACWATASEEDRACDEQGWMS